MTDYKKFGYHFIDNEFFEFYCDPSVYKEIVDGDSVYVSGTFNGWINGSDSSWLLKKTIRKGKVFYLLQKKIADIDVPGNSGFPEFRFYVISSDGHHVLKENPNEKNVFLNNRLILKDKEDIEFVKKLKSFKIVKTMEDFNLDCPACRSEIANFRLTPGTSCLYRGYHPYKRSRPELDTEDSRLDYVLKALEKYGIQSDITLSGYEAASSYENEKMPEIIEKIEKNENRLCLDIDYNLVYFHSDAAEFSNILRTISRFIISKPAPFYIHCRLGSDRTGVTCAIFAALCGASWEEIAEDYEKTSNCGIGEYRNRKLLSYSLKRMIGYAPENAANLCHLMQSYFLKENILSAEELERLVKKLSFLEEKRESDFFDFAGKHIC